MSSNTDATFYERSTFEPWDKMTVYYTKDKDRQIFTPTSPRWKHISLVICDITWDQKTQTGQKSMVVLFSSLARILWECLTIHYSSVIFFFFFEVEISSSTLIPLFMPRSVHSGSASWDDCGQMLLDKLCVNFFLDRFPHYAWTKA